MVRPDVTAARQIAIDGQTVRHSFDRKRGRSPLRPVSAFAPESGPVLAQRASGDKDGGTAVLPEPLDGLDLRGGLVRLDALAGRPEIAGHILARGGDCLIPFKAHQRTMDAEVEGWVVAHAFSPHPSLHPCADACDDGHGRRVRRRVFASSDVGVFATLKDWPSLAVVLAVETIRGVNGTGTVTAEIRHYLSSAQRSPEALASALRHHWTIENGSHGVLDVGFGADASRARERTAARNWAVLRRIALNLTRANTSKASLKGQRTSAAWDNTFMATLVTQ